MLKIITHSERETRALGEAMGRKIKPGAVLALAGDLGSGKTVFTRGLARGMRIKTRIKSPSFALLHSYPRLRHLDLYRLKSRRELTELGLNSLLRDRRAVTVIEWPELVAGLLPKQAVRIKFTHGKKTNERIINVS